MDDILKRKNKLNDVNSYAKNKNTQYYLHKAKILICIIHPRHYSTELHYSLPLTSLTIFG